jgi:hypothetical protein
MHDQDRHTYTHANIYIRRAPCTCHHSRSGRPCRNCHTCHSCHSGAISLQQSSPMHGAQVPQLLLLSAHWPLQQASEPLNRGDGVRACEAVFWRRKDTHGRQTESEEGERANAFVPHVHQTPRKCATIAYQSLLHIPQCCVLVRSTHTPSQQVWPLICVSESTGREEEEEEEEEGVGGVKKFNNNKKHVHTCCVCVESERGV